MRIRVDEHTLWNKHNLPDIDVERLTRDGPTVGRLLAWAQEEA